ncbi:MAG TPA: anaerobic glycerol-3-phosphate dehydrogenase subunit C, partial [Pirellulaceae bacterium]|nr:anaerobic glycerol-3-phosphate dehydrogenase subunit C [Pirellulaceae bacterium]
EVSKLGVASCDLMDRRLLSIAREIDERYARLIPRDAEALLLIEIQAEGRDELRDRLQNLVTQLQRRKRLAFASSTTMEREERDLYWRLTRRVVPTLYRLKGSSRPVPFVEDLAVPPEALADFLVRLQNVLKTHQVTASLFGHAGHGQLHVRPFMDISNPNDVRKMQDLAADIYAEVMAVGGTISGEHGDGLSRTWYVRRQYGPLYDVFREVKRIFDPQNLFNPGKVIADVPQPLTKNMRPVTLGGALVDPNDEEASSTAAATTIATSENPEARFELPQVPFELHLAWPDNDIIQAARNCNGCGRCRTHAADARMCPIFRISPEEEASPRAKANLVRAVLTGQLKPDQLASEDAKKLADLCVNCHQCRFECPAGVDIPKLVIETKSQYVVNNGLTISDWFVSRLDTVANWASLFSPLANWGLGNRQMRWLLEKAFGIAQGRKLPRVAGRNFLRRAQRKRWTRSSKQAGRKVLYFVDTYANWFDVQLAEACIAVLEHNGAAVYVHPQQLSSAMAQITLGDVERAKPIAQRNVALLAEAVRQGYTIVCTEPSAALALTHEYLNLLDDDDARLVAANTSEVCSYLFQLHKNGLLELDLKPINATFGYHEPCHLRALPNYTAGEHLLRLVPGLTVQTLDRGCSGMAGTFGMKRENYRASLRAGWGLITALRDPEIQFGSTECSTCKMQMEQGTTKPTIHPLKVLALAYGLMPELAALFNARSEELIVT